MILNFKKITSSVSALMLCAGLLTACGGDDKPSESETTTSVSETTVVSEEMSVSDPDIETDTDTEAAGDGGITEDEGVSENPLQFLADAAISSGEWPTLWEVTDPQMLSDFFLLDAENENYRNMIVLQCPMSANMTEIIIIEADDTEAAKTDLEARRQKAIEQDAFYPNDVDKAEASIIGTAGDYAYFILADSASSAEAALVEAINAV